MRLAVTGLELAEFALWHGFTLNGLTVNGLTAWLTVSAQGKGFPFPLALTRGKAVNTEAV